MYLSGKSTLAQVIMGNPQFTEDFSGKLLLEGEDVAKLTPDERARKGLFLSFQSPLDIPGVSFFDMLRQAHIAVTGKNIELDEYQKLLKDKPNLPTNIPAPHPPESST